MFCQNCGLESTPGVNFCKRCGTNFGATSTQSENRPSPPRVAGMFWAIAMFGFGSLSVLLGSIIALAAIGADEDAIIPATIMGTGAIIAIAWLLIRQLSRLINLYQSHTETSPQKSVNQARDTYPQLEAPPRHVSSVTEHTTRNFDPVLGEEWRSRNRE